MRIKSLLYSMMFFASLAGGGEVCDLGLLDCPSKLQSAGVITVPKSVIWLDPKIPFCQEAVEVSAGGSAASIFFIIDNSGSMDGNDPDESRFSVVSSLLDQIHATAPGTEVGLAIFSRRLSFDHRDNPLFQTAFPSDTSQHDSYVPLMALNKVFSDGKTGLDTLKSLLKHDNSGKLTYGTRQARTRTRSAGNLYDLREGTDITLGFQAAKLAMADAKAAKANRFFFFLSDGEPTSVDSIRESAKLDFIRGEQTPTTFTVYFDADKVVPVAPQTIKDMTANIKANGYSSSNGKSDYWAVNTPGTQLQAILQNQITGVLALQTQPKQAVLTARGVSYNNSSIDAMNFVFPQRVPLDSNQTVLQLSYTYTYIDTTGGKSEKKEKVVPYTLTVQRSAAAATVSAGTRQTCREGADLNLYSDKGRKLSLVTADHEQLEIRLVPPAGETCTGCKVEVKPSKTGDAESVSLVSGGGYVKGGFGREVSSTPVAGNGVLQHVTTDSIILIYVNPANPLEVVRKSYPYSDVRTALDLIRHNDYSRVGGLVGANDGNHWVLVAPADLAVISLDPKEKCCGILTGTLSKEDSLGRVGLLVEASREFTLEAWIYSNLGVLVSKTAFTVSKTEFDKLELGNRKGIRLLKVLWNNRAQDGRLAGTGAYIMKTSVTLHAVGGVGAETRIDFRRVGVLRDR